MAEVSINVSISSEDRAAIVADVVAALIPLLNASSERLLVNGDRMAELLSISRPMLDRMRAAGTVPSVMVGRRRLYRPAAVLEALECSEKKVTDE